MSAIDDVVRLMMQQADGSFDSVAEVLRIDGNTAYVHFSGGAEETPVELAINAKPGDQVRVRVSGGHAWIVGNLSAPPTDDTLAELALENLRATNARIDNLFAEDITATGTIRGLKLKGSTITGSQIINEGQDGNTEWQLVIKDGFINIYDKTTGKVLARYSPYNFGIEDNQFAALFSALGTMLYQENASGFLDNVLYSINGINAIKESAMFTIKLLQPNGKGISALLSVNGDDGKVTLTNSEIWTDKPIVFTRDGVTYETNFTLNPSGRFQIQTKNGSTSHYWLFDPNGYEMVDGVKQQYSKNDTITMASSSANYTLGGFLTSNGTIVYMTYPLNKPLASDVAGVTCTGIKARVRQGGKYILGSGTAGGEAAPTSISAALTANRDGVHILMTIPAASASNNDAVGIQLNAGTIKFT